MGSASKKATTLLDRIKANMLETGGSTDKFKSRFMIRAGETKRMRFISDLTDAIPVIIHSRWETLYPTPCQSHFGPNCPYCGNEDYKTAEWYAFTVRDLDEKKLTVFAYSTSSWSPLPLLVNPFEEYGTLTDRPNKITKGTGPGVAWNLVPEDGKRTWKRQFKPFTAEEVYEVLNAGRKIKAANGNGRP